jgi:hypothetical protein
MFEDHFETDTQDGLLQRRIGRGELSPFARGLRSERRRADQFADPSETESAQTFRYFTSVLSDLLAYEAAAAGPIRWIGPNAFEARGSRGRVVSALRFTTKSVVDSLVRHRPDHLIVFIDDNLWALKGAELPEGYRYRLAKKRETVLAPLLSIADEIASPSRRILARFDTKQRSLVNAGQHLPLPTLDHHDDKRGVHMVFSGNRSHINDLACIADDLAELLAARPDITLTTFLGRHAPPALRGANVRHLEPMPWSSFRDFMRYNRFHIALYPSQPSDFCRSRSVSAIVDAGLWGAAGIFASLEPFYSYVDHKHSGLLVEAAKGSWKSAITTLANDRQRLAGMARKGQDHAQTIGDQSALRRFWIGRFGLARELTLPMSRRN